MEDSRSRSKPPGESDCVGVSGVGKATLQFLDDAVLFRRRTDKFVVGEEELAGGGVSKAQAVVVEAKLQVQDLRDAADDSVRRGRQADRSIRAPCVEAAPFQYRGR